jgi:serine/threonine-protein kinase
MNRVVALKVIRPDALDRTGALERFHQEIQSAARLGHPNIVVAHDANEVGGKLFLTMEYVEGQNLSQLVKQRGPLSIRDACDFIRQAALGLEHAHESGLVHRDIKPSNLLVTPAGAVKILDMGLARPERRNGDTELTDTGSVVGTADYIAPEQALNARRADARSDVYSLGCTLYFLLTGRPPFPEGTFTEKLMKHNMEDATPIEQLRPEIPAGLAAIVRRMMAKNPTERLARAAAVAEALGPYCAVEAVVQGPITPVLPRAATAAWDKLTEDPAPSSSVPLALARPIAHAPSHSRRGLGQAYRRPCAVEQCASRSCQAHRACAFPLAARLPPGRSRRRRVDTSWRRRLAGAAILGPDGRPCGRCHTGNCHSGRSGAPRKGNTQ